MALKKFRKYAKKQVGRAAGYLTNRYKQGGMSQVLKDVSMLKGLVNSELKYCENATSNAVQTAIVSGTPRWSLYPLNELVQGDGPGQRNGSSVRFKSLQIKGLLERNAGNHRCRVIIFIDKECFASGLRKMPQPEELLAIQPTMPKLDALREWDGIQEKRFKVLYDRVYTLDATKSVQTHFSIYRKMDMATKWAKASTVGDTQINNSLWIAFISDATAVTDIRHDYTCRLTYRDN